jgi:hypothetical protein
MALKLLNNRYFIIVVKFHELHMYMVSHTMSCIHCNSCNLFNNIHACKNTLGCNELQMNYKWSLQLKNSIVRLVANHPIFSQW